MAWSLEELLKNIGNSAADVNPTPQRQQAPTPTSQYVNSPMDPLKNQIPLIDAMVSPEALRPTLYDYSSTPQQNAAAGAPLAQSLPGPVIPTIKPEIPAPAPKRSIASVPTPAKLQDTLSMSGDSYMAKMLREGQPAAQPEQQPASDQMQAEAKPETKLQPETDADLKAAQESRRNNLLALALLQGSNKAGAGLAGVKADDNYGKNLEGLANLPMTEFLEKRTNSKEKQNMNIEREKFLMDKETFAQDIQLKQASVEKAKAEVEDKKAQRDPNSNISKSARDFFNKTYETIGIKIQIPDGISYEQMKAFDDSVGKMFDSKLRADSLKESIAARKEAAKHREEDKKTARQEDFISKTSEKLVKTDEYKALRAIDQAVDNLDASIKQATATGDIAAIYKFMKALDADSAVREAEIELARSGQGAIANLRTTLTQASSSPRILTPKYIQQMRDYMKAIRGAADARYRRVADLALKQATSRGIGNDKFDQIDPAASIPKTSVSNGLDASAAAKELERRGLK